MSTDNASGKGKDRVERAEQPGPETSATKVTVTNSPAAPPTKRSWMTDYLAASGDHQGCDVPFAALADRYCH